MLSPSMLRVVAASSTFSVLFAPAFGGTGSGTQAAQPQWGLPAFTTLPLNGSFEYADPFTAAPFGYTNHSDAEPTWPLPVPIVPQDGNRVICINPSPIGQSRQWSTDTSNFFQWPGSGPVPKFDPAFDWNGGDVEVKLFYLIPASNPIVEGPFGVKLNIKGAADPNQDNATRDPFGGAGPIVTGHTNNQWVEYTVVWPIADIQAEVLANAAAFNWTLPPYPDRLKISIQRFSADPQNGRIYVDNVRYRQIPTTPVGCNIADITDDGDTGAGPDGQLTLDDILLFINEYNDATGCPGTPPCNKADITDDGNTGAGPDGQLSLDDILAFIDAYNEGCA